MIATQKNIRRDAIAVTTGGVAEYNVSGMRADVGVVRGENCIDFYEVKADPADLQRAIGQFDMYGHESGRESGRSILVAVMPRNMSLRRQWRSWLKRVEPALNRLNVEIRAVSELVNLPDHYEIAGEQFTDRAGIEKRLAQVKMHWSYADYLCSQNRDFLMALAQHYCRRRWQVPAVDVELSHSRNGVMATVHSGQYSASVDNHSLVRSWLEIEHHRWANCPTHVGLSYA